MGRRLKMLDQFYNGVNQMNEDRTKCGTGSFLRNVWNGFGVFRPINKYVFDGCVFKECESLENGNNQEIKADKGKIKPTLVPPQIIRDIAKVREYGCLKYKDPNNWKKVEKERYEDAFLRHTLAWMDARDSKDAESGIEHYKHMACNLAFLCEMYKEDEENGMCKMEEAEEGKQE